ncbi:MAG: enoyl-CoA hydratase/isomerase family protein [Promethearchaeota archaeon]|nr:MAG: enoyl-CoA hydratase/isomerase family protein [Candidatus Lokiarchaeota archaeon]
MSDQEFLLYEVKGRVAIITINRPDKAHAFTIAMLKRMHEFLEKADEDEKVKCIIIKSTGEKFFSAGYDLKEIQGDPENVKQVTTWGRKVNEKIMLMKKTVITQIQGVAIGFGVLMIVASDLRIFANRPKEELYIRLPELIISAFPQTGATLMPLLAFGFTNAKKFLFTGDNIGLQELKNMNFPTRIFPIETIDEDSLSFAKGLCKIQTPFLFFTKIMLTIMNKAYIKSCLDLEDECGKIAYGERKTMKELEDIIQDLYKRYP